MGSFAGRPITFGRSDKQCSTHPAEPGLGQVLATDEKTDDDLVCFQKPIAIEPFVLHFRSLMNDVVTPIR